MHISADLKLQFKLLNNLDDLKLILQNRFLKSCQIMNDFISSRLNKSRLYDNFTESPCCAIGAVWWKTL